MIFGLIISFAVIKTKDVKEHNNVEVFNSELESYSGTKRKMFVSLALDKIVTNNKKNTGHLITVKFEETEILNPDQIIEIKKKLNDFTEYEVSYEYDSDGYINTMIIKK